MKRNRRYRTTLLFILLTLLLSLFSVISFAQVDGDMPTYEEGAENERRAD